MTKGLAPDWLITDPLYLAIRLAASAHHNQLDKGGDPYLWHVLRVGISLLPDLDAAIVGVLHDVLEDSPGCAPAVRQLLKPSQYEALRALTHWSTWSGGPSESYDA